MSGVDLSDQSAFAKLAVSAVSFSRHLREREAVPDDVRTRFDAALARVEGVVAADPSLDLYADYPGCGLLLATARVVGLLPREREISVELGRALDGAAGLVLKRGRSIYAPDDFQERLALQ